MKEILLQPFFKEDTAMRKNLYWKSSLRQPVRSLLLMLLCGIAAFSFLNQALQALALTRAVREISEFYRPVGYLEAVPID